jgi:KUP system potassium uptake protein
MQAVQMGYLPRLVILHTSPNEKGQIYVPAINWALMLACLGLVLGFRSSANLAAAYGVAVTATMVITTLLFWTYLIDGWRWPWWRAGIVCGFFLCVELVFLTANALKIPQGGWFPLLVGYLLFVVMSTWKRGRQIVFAMLQSRTRPLQEVITTTLPVEAPARVPGVAIYMYGNREGCPPALLANLRHNHALHEKVVVLSVTTADQPYVWSSERSQVTALEDGFWRVNLCYGFLEQPNVFATLHGLVMGEDKLDPNQATFFLGRETVIPRRDRRSEMSHWQEMLFAYMTRNALDATNFSQIPPDRVVELGTQLEI